jgi:uncharacterized cupin superfamily protein
MSAVERFDFRDPQLRRDDSAPEGVDALGVDIERVIGGADLHGSLYEIGPGRKGFPYHWEAAREEWLIVLEGTPTVRTPDGEHELRPGDLVCFPTGPEGAHQLLNHSDARVRFIFVSNATVPNVVTYPDSGKVGVRIDDDNRFIFRQDDAVPYWTGES